MTETAPNDADRFAGTRAAENLPHSCRCGTRWNGQRTAHCAAECHLTFSGETSFRRHRRDGRCLNPAEVGMSLLPGRPYECWGYPGEAGGE